MKKNFLATTFLALCTIMASAQVIPYQQLPTPATKPGSDLVLEYSSPRDEVIVQGGKLTHISKTYHYDHNRPQVAAPIGTSQRTVLNAEPLNGRQLTALEQGIHSSGIFNLTDSSYGAPDGQSSYDYRIKVRMNGQQRDIVFRSNPSYSYAPQAFEVIKDYVWRLVTEVEAR